MVEISRQQLVVYAAAAARGRADRRAVPEGTSATRRRPRPGRRRVKVGARGPAARLVHVTGAVRRPGVYRLPSWARLDAAIRRAGGATARADLQGVNLAAKVVGRPAGDRARARGRRGAPAPRQPPRRERRGRPVSLNTATVEQLDELDGIGPATAQKILDWRKEHGGFGSVEDLSRSAASARSASRR